LGRQIAAGGREKQGRGDEKSSLFIIEREEKGVGSKTAI